MNDNSSPQGLESLSDDQSSGHPTFEKNTPSLIEIIDKIERDVSWSEGRPIINKEWDSTRNFEQKEVGVRLDLAQTGDKFKPDSRLGFRDAEQLRENKKLRAAGTDLLARTPEAPFDVQASLYLEALTTRSYLALVEDQSKMREVRVVEYREGFTGASKDQPSNRHIIVMDANTARAEALALTRALAQTNKQAQVFRPVTAPPESISINDALAEAARPRAAKVNDAIVLHPVEAADQTASEKGDGVLVTAQRGSTININTLETSIMRIGRGSDLGPGVSRVQVTDAPATMSRDAVDLVFAGGNLVDVVTQSENNSITIIAENPQNLSRKSEIILPKSKGQGIPQGRKAEVNLSDANLRIRIDCGTTAYELVRQGIGGTGQSFTLN